MKIIKIFSAVNQKFIAWKFNEMYRKKNHKNVSERMKKRTFPPSMRQIENVFFFLGKKSVCLQNFFCIFLLWLRMWERNSPTHRFNLKTVSWVCVFVHAVAIAPPSRCYKMCVDWNDTSYAVCLAASLYLSPPSIQSYAFNAWQPLFSLAFYVNRRVCYFITV